KDLALVKLTLSLNMILALPKAWKSISLGE
ncbi:hypothetical protein A2U01_0092814, partial [Trifolium medium]|nr:hypothetical protein [Trifolium medium]